VLNNLPVIYCNQARHGFAWILLLLFIAAILRVPLFLARDDALLMTTVTLLTFVSEVPTTVHGVICFSVFFDEGDSQLFLIFCGTVATMCTTSFVDKISTFCSHSECTHFVWMLEQTSIISLYGIKWMVFLDEKKCVYCAVRTGI
jgi:hypothetical protein